MYKVLLVEDEAFIRRGLRYTFEWEKLNCEVIGEAENGEEGLALIKDLSPHIIIVDVNMPRLDGISMLKQISDNIICSTILLTGYDDFHIAKEAIHLDVTEYLLKPVDHAQLTMAVEKAKKHVHMQKMLREIETPKLGLKSELDALILPVSLSTIQSRYVLKMVKYVHEHYACKFTMRDLEKELQVSGTYLNKLFKQETNYTFNDYVNRYRVYCAMEKMRTSNDKVYIIAEKVGIKDYKYFTMIFKKYTNLTPKQYQASYSTATIN